MSEQDDYPVEGTSPLIAWGEIEGYRLLCKHFELTDGFALVVIFAPDEQAIAALREQMRSVFSSQNAFQRVRFDPEQGTESLAESLIEKPQTKPGLRLLWIDSDPCLPDELDRRHNAWGQALARLNRHRNAVQANFDCTLAIALPTRWQQTFRENAPDLWSIRAGLFRIEVPGSTTSFIRQLPNEEQQSLLARFKEGDTGDPNETLAAAEKLRGNPGREAVLAKLLQRAGNQFLNRQDRKWAQGYLEEAYVLAENTGDPELRWDVATDLAGVLYGSAQFQRAEYYLKRALDIAEQHFGRDGANTAIALNNLAQLLQDTNRLAEAEPLMRRALDIGEQAYGPEHPNVAIRLNNLAQLLQDTNRLAEAEPLMRRALDIGEQAYGAEHPKVATGLNNLAQLLQDTNRLAEAEPLMRRALDIDEQAYGPEHPNVAIRLNNLASLLQKTNRLAEAEPLMRRMVEIFLKFTQATGHPHPHLNAALNNYAVLLQAMEVGEDEISKRLSDLLAEYGPPLG
jgi:hypothetical protein